MSRLDNLTDEKLDKALTLLWSTHAWLRGTLHESPTRFVRHAIAILEGTDEQEPKDGTEQNTPEAEESTRPGQAAS